jgi:hypothetical protein
MFIFLNLDRSTNVQTQYWVAFRTCEKRDDLLVASGQETSAACWIGSPDFLWLAEPVRSYRQHLACIAGIGVGVFFSMAPALVVQASNQTLVVVVDDRFMTTT